MKKINLKIFAQSMIKQPINQRANLKFKLLNKFKEKKIARNNFINGTCC